VGNEGGKGTSGKDKTRRRRGDVLILNLALLCKRLLCLAVLFHFFWDKVGKLVPQSISIHSIL